MTLAIASHRAILATHHKRASRDDTQDIDAQLQHLPSVPTVVHFRQWSPTEIPAIVHTLQHPHLTPQMALALDLPAPQLNNGQRVGQGLAFVAQEVTHFTQTYGFDILRRYGGFCIDYYAGKNKHHWAYTANYVNNVVAPIFVATVRHGFPNGVMSLMPPNSWDMTLFAIATSAGLVSASTRPSA